MRIENRLVRNVQRPQVHLCTECNVENHLITGEPGEDPIEKAKARFRVVQPTKRKTTKGRVPSIEEFTAEQTKESYCREDTT